MNTVETTTADRPKLLTVDDEINILKSLKRTLRRCDIDVTIANSGKEALEIMETQQFDVIMSDMRMPEMTGAEFLAEACKRQPESKRILLTGYSDIQSTVDAINNGGVSTYLTKPWDDAHLINVIEDAVRVKQLLSQNASLEETTKRQNEELKSLNSGLEEKVAERTKEIEQASSMLEKAMGDLTSSYDTMVALLANTAALRDKTGCESNEQKQSLALTLAALTKMKTEELHAVEQAMQLHRIGTLSLPDSMLSTPYMAYSDSDKAKFNQHPVFAEATLMGVAELNDAASLIRNQHEHWDGRGYPDGKIKEATPLGSRIIALARDYYDLMSGLLERKKLSSEDALAYIEKESGTRYDPSLVLILVGAIGATNDQQAGKESITLDIVRLRPGMTLAKDLKSPEGMMLLRRNQQLTDAMIQKIANLSRTASADFQVEVECE